MSDSSRVLEEYAMVYKLKHKCIIRPIAYTVARTTVQEDLESSPARTETVITYMAVYEYCRNGDLATYLQDNPEKVNDLPWITSVLDSILEALAHVHERNHIHTDIKPDNVRFISAYSHE
jgi:serine/threonine protein kinase